MSELDLIQTLNTQLGIELPESISRQKLQERLSEFINDLIEHDFQKLIGILYKVDVSEQKLKHLLQQNINENAADIIAKLLIERQLQKIETRKLFRNKDVSDSEEKW